MIESCESYIDVLNEETERDILSRVPNAAVVVVLDAYGKTTSFRISDTDARPVEFPLPVKEITDPPETISLVKITVNPPAVLVYPSSGGSPYWYHKRHRT